MDRSARPRAVRRKHQALCPVYHQERDRAARGIAVERTLIGSVDEPVFTYFPYYADLRTREKDGIWLRHLLTMSPGFDWDEYRAFSDPQNSGARIYQSPEPYRFVLQQPLATQSGNSFRTTAALLSFWMRCTIAGAAHASGTEIALS